MFVLLKTKIIFLAFTSEEFLRGSKIRTVIVRFDQYYNSIPEVKLTFHTPVLFHDFALTIHNNPMNKTNTMATFKTKQILLLFLLFHLPCYLTALLAYVRSLI